MMDHIKHFYFFFAEFIYGNGCSTPFYCTFRGFFFYWKNRNFWHDISVCVCVYHNYTYNHYTHTLEILIECKQKQTKQTKLEKNEKKNKIKHKLMKMIPKTARNTKKNLKSNHIFWRHTKITYKLFSNVFFLI